jgi:hypothetical protein
MLPAAFNWPLYISALLLMAVPIFEVSGKIFRQSQPRHEAAAVTIAE